MKIYSKVKMEKPTKFGDVTFEWSGGGDNITRVCTQHSLQPALFFEELLREAGYRQDGEQ